MLDPDEIHELIRRWQEAGDVKARDRICRSFYRLAWSTAKRHENSLRGHFEDAVQEGMIGILRAIDKFDPNKGVKFTTYVPYWINAFVFSMLRTKVSVFRVKRSSSNGLSFRQVEDAAEQLEKAGIPPTEEAVANVLGVRLPAVQTVYAAMRAATPVALDVDTSMALVELANLRSPEDLVIEAEERYAAEEAMAAVRERLTDAREIAVLQRRLLSDSPATLSEIGDDFGVTKERIRQIQLRIERRVRETVAERRAAA